MALTRITKALVFIHFVSLYPNSMWDREASTNNLCDIYDEMCPNNFGRLIACLTLVYQVADSCEEEIIREVAQRTVEDFKYIDLEKYKVKRSIPFKALLNQLLIRTVFAYFA